MDPFIDPEALDPRHPLTARKLDNLARADHAMGRHEAVFDTLPSKLTLQTTDACNLACPHCQIPTAAKKPAMGREVLAHVRTQLLDDLIELHPTNLGEPFAWPWFRELCALMLEHGVVLDLTTNGTLLSPRRLEWIAPIARDVKVSFDGATAPTFERFRRGADFEQVCSNVAWLVQRLRTIATRRPVVSLQMTLMRDTVAELPELGRLAARLGADRVKAYHLFSFGDDLDEQSLMGSLELYEERVLPEALDVGAELGVDLQLAEPSGGAEGDMTPRTCFLPWHETWVDVDGAVLLCHSHGGEVAGRVDAFSEAWMGPLYRNVREGFAAGLPTGACADCGMRWEKTSEHQAVPFDPGSFLSDGRATGSTRWSGRMRPFQLQGRR